jgi:hypothetical protein
MEQTIKHCKLVQHIDMNICSGDVDMVTCLPWFTNSFGELLLPEASLGCAPVLIEDILCRDCKALFSISCGLELQKSSDKLRLFTERPWILKPFVGSSTAIIGVGWAQPKQPLLCCKPGLTKKWLVLQGTWRVTAQINKWLHWKQIVR